MVTYSNIVIVFKSFASNSVACYSVPSFRSRCRKNTYSLWHRLLGRINSYQCNMSRGACAFMCMHYAHSPVSTDTVFLCSSNFCPSIYLSILVYICRNQTLPVQVTGVPISRWSCDMTLWHCDTVTVHIMLTSASCSLLKTLLSHIVSYILHVGTSLKHILQDDKS